MPDPCVQDFARLRPQLLKFALRRLRNRERAEDAVHDALVAAIEGAQAFAGDSSLRTWLLGILKHKIGDCMRRSIREQPLDEMEMPLPDADPEASLTSRRFVGALERSLARLPENAARVFLLREVMGMEVAEICNELAISSSNCWVMLHRVRMRLRECPEIRRFAADAL